MTAMKAILATAFLGLALGATAAEPAKPPSHPAAPAGQKTYSSPDEAARALIQAATADDIEALKQIFGPSGLDLVVTGDDVQDKNRAKAFADQAATKHRIERDPKDAKRAILSVGDDDWPLPIPIVQGPAGHWYFDTKAGRQEILYRRIGQNELDAIEICEGFVEAQDEYASTKHDGATINQYAQRMVSTPGKQDGLAWQKPDGTWDGPVAETIANAIAEGYTDRAQPYHGYFFKVLKGQGSHAKFGALDFVVNNVMIGGFALVAAPAEYRGTGVKTFIVNQDGVVYEKDLGAKTLDAFKAMTIFDPDKGWTPVHH
ncbi:MAG TPA: DUF2950 domain-containing protein [Candidatus Polarisedimenticolaceae bacterium]|nr:DUF2950 domain-containing protein [Candidatus Polarisedimenticolaceae bacterium]